MSSLITVALTVISGALTLVVGQFLLKGFLEPILDLKRQIGRIAHDLDFYGNQMRGETPLADEAREKFRRHACELREKLNTALIYRGLRRLFRLPSEEDIKKASSELIGHSNFPKDPQPGFDIDRAPMIRNLLKIKT